MITELTEEQRLTWAALKGLNHAEITEQVKAGNYGTEDWATHIKEGFNNWYYELAYGICDDIATQYYEPDDNTKEMADLWLEYIEWAYIDKGISYAEVWKKAERARDDYEYYDKLLKDTIQAWQRDDIEANMKDRWNDYLLAEGR